MESRKWPALRRVRGLTRLESKYDSLQRYDTRGERNMGVFADNDFVCVRNACKDDRCDTEVRQMELMRLLSERRVSVRPVRFEVEDARLNVLCMENGGVDLDARYDIPESDLVHLEKALEDLAVALASTCIMHCDFGMQFNPGNVVYNIKHKRARLVDFDLGFIRQIRGKRGPAAYETLKGFWAEVANVYYLYYRTRRQTADELMHEPAEDVAERKLKEIRERHLADCTLGEALASVRMQHIQLDAAFLKTPNEELFKSKVVDLSYGLMTHRTQTPEMQRLQI